MKWTSSATPIAQTVTVNEAGRRMETAMQGVNDPSAGTGSNDAWDVGVKVWFTSNLADDNYNRVYIKTLRAKT